MDNNKIPYTNFVTVGYKRNNPFKMNYSIHGKGDEKIIWIGGFLCRLEFYDTCSKYFESLEKYTIVTFDQAGIGNSDDASVTSLKDLALDTLELIEHLKWEKVNVIGFSLGSMIGYELSKLAPERIKSLNMASPNTPLNHFNNTIIKFLGYHPFLDLFLYGVDPVCTFLNSMISQSFLDAPSKIKNGTNKEFIFPLLKKIRNDLNIPIKSIIQHYFLSTFYKLTPSHTDKKTLLNRSFPICIFVGTNDQLYHWKTIVKTCEIIQPNKIFICKGSGHLVFAEDPNEFFNQSEQFFSYKQPKKEFLTITPLEYKDSNLKPQGNPFAYRSIPFTQLPIFKKFKTQSLFLNFNPRLFLKK